MQPLIAFGLQGSEYKLIELKLKPPDHHQWVIDSVRLRDHANERNFELRSLIFNYDLDTLSQGRIQSLAIGQVKVMDETALQSAPSSDSRPLLLILNQLLKQWLDEFTLQQLSYQSQLLMINLYDGHYTPYHLSARLELPPQPLQSLTQLAANAGIELPDLNLHRGNATITAELESDLTPPFSLQDAIQSIQGSLHQVTLEQFGGTINNLSAPFPIQPNPRNPGVYSLAIAPLTIQQIELPPVGSSSSETIDQLQTALALQIKPDSSTAPLHAVKLSTFSFQLLGGTIRSLHPINIQQNTGKATLQLQQIELSRLLKMAGSHALNISGALRGELPITIEQGAVKIQNGSLNAAPSGGVIRFNPPTISLGEQGINQALQALSNFHYKRLKATVDFDSQSMLIKIQATINGHNPDFMEGREVELNLNLSEQLRFRTY